MRGIGSCLHPDRVLKMGLKHSLNSAMTVEKFIVYVGLISLADDSSS